MKKFYLHRQLLLAVLAAGAPVFADIISGGANLRVARPSQ